MNLTEFADEMRPLFNEICMLYDTDLVRLVGVAQGEFDLYYIVRSMRPQPNGQKTTFASAVGRCYGLKAYLPAERYAQTDHDFGLNGAGPAETFAVIDETAGERYTPS